MILIVNLENILSTTKKIKIIHKSINNSNHRRKPHIPIEKLYTSRKQHYHDYHRDLLNTYYVLDTDFMALHVITSLHSQNTPVR